MANGKKSKMRLVTEEEVKPTDNEPLSIPKPTASDKLAKFKSKRTVSSGNVETLLPALPHHNIAAAKDFVRLHPTAWSNEWCFVNVPIKGQKQNLLHLIDEDLALAYLSKGRLL